MRDWVEVGRDGIPTYGVVAVRTVVEDVLVWRELDRRRGHEASIRSR